MLTLLEAAQFTRLHPMILKAGTREKPLRKDGFRLPATVTAGGLTFEEIHLREFLTDLGRPWAPGPKPRPTIPESIVQVLQVECGLLCGQCRLGSYHYQKAHIDSWDTSLSHHPHNLILLCDGCHEAYDDLNILQVDAIRQAKIHLIDSMMRSLREGALMVHTQKYQNLQELCLAIEPRLQENWTLFESFGPFSPMAAICFEEGAAEVWHRYRQDKILPNNESVRQMLLDNIALYRGNTDFSAASSAFIAHAASYAEFVRQPNEIHKYLTFPGHFADAVRKEAAGGA